MEEINKRERKVFLDTLLKWESGANKGKINWNININKFVHFIYENIEGDIKIIDYVSRGQMLTIKYKQNTIKLRTSAFTKCNIGKVLGKVTKEFKIEIGTILKDKKRDLTITDREYRKEENVDKLGRKSTANKKWYKYKCNKCNYESWTLETTLIKGCKCACCSNKVIVEGVNDIPTTAPWMIKYFVGGIEEAKLYTKCSGKKVYPICPCCGRVKKSRVEISYIYNYNSIGCNCSDSISYPEKLMFNILEQMNVDFQTQLSKSTFKWCENKRYDFYFELNNEKYIIETHGLQHYKNTKGYYIEKSKGIQVNDRIKKELALANGIKGENYIVIDCRYSSLEFIKQNVLESRLNDIFDLSKIDWNECDEFALSNLLKEVCNYWNDKLSIVKISQKTKLNVSTIRDYLHEGNKHKWCSYDGETERRKNGSILGKTKGKQIICINTGDIFCSQKDCEAKSLDKFGVKLSAGLISAVCLGKRNHHHNLKFKYTSDLTEEEIKEIQENAKQNLDKII